MPQVGTLTPKQPKTTMTEEEFIAGCKQTIDGSVPSVNPTTITVLADNGFTVLHESTHGIVTKGYTVSEEELHLYEEDLGTIKQLSDAINRNTDTTVVVSRDRERGTYQRIYVTPSFVINRNNNIHCLRGHLDSAQMIVDEAADD